MTEVGAVRSAARVDMVIERKLTCAGHKQAYALVYMHGNEDPLEGKSGASSRGSADVAYRTPLAPYEKSNFLGSRGSMVARLKLKGIDGRGPPGVEPAT
ncbi:hypothetical protein Tco_1227225 [Tanacetum coccineum]